MTVRRIAVATFGRSDFSILRPLCRLLVADPRFDAGWWAAGAHFEPVSGRTVTDVEASGVPIWARIDCATYGPGERSTVATMAAHMDGTAAVACGTELHTSVVDVTIADGRRPDLVLILGDRFEAVATGLALVPFGIPVGHISGGSITEGAIDDVFRHCLTKIAALHACDLPEFARRIQLMGEPPSRIATTGAPGLDAFAGAAPHPFAEFTARFGLHGLRPGYLLATIHPESRHPDQTGPMTEATLAAMTATGHQVVVTYPNADPGADEVVAIIQAHASAGSVYVVRGFGADWYPTAMANAAAMVGNSSGGIIEAASFGLPVVDVGDRQRGRARGANVLHAERDRASIGAALTRALDPAFIPVARAGNIYGDGRGAQRVVAALATLDWETLPMPKHFADPDPGFVGELMELPCD